MDINGYLLGVSIVLFWMAKRIAIMELEKDKETQSSLVGIAIIILGIIVLAVFCLGKAFEG